MRRAKRVMLWASCAVPAVAAMVMTGVGTAGATTTTPVVSQLFNNQTPNLHSGYPGQGNGWGNGNGNGWGNGHNPPSCSKWQLEKWNLNGGNTVDLTYEGGAYTYSVTITQKGSCLTGTLTDKYYSTPALTGPISGTVKGDDVTFTFNYPANSVQGARTFTGTIGRHGAVSGTWGETGSEHGTGTWTLADNASPACPPWFRWHRGPHECQVR